MHDQKVSRESHTWVQERLSEYLDDRLSPLERAQIERHVQTCRVCQRELDSLRWTISLVQAAPKPRLPRQFTLPVSASPARAPLFGMSMLRLATAVATLVLVSLIGVDLIMQFGSGKAQSSAAPLSSAQLAAPTRAALAIATSTELRKDAAAGAAERSSQATAVPTAVPTTPVPEPTMAPRSAVAPAAATAVPPPSLTPTPLSSRAFSGPASSTGVGQPAPTSSPTAAIVGLGAGPAATVPASKVTTDSNAPSPVPTEVLPAVPPAVQSVPTVEPTPTVASSALASQATVPTNETGEGNVPPTGAPPQPTTELPSSAPTELSPLRIAELATLFVAVFLGALLVLLRLRR